MKMKTVGATIYILLALLLLFACGQRGLRESVDSQSPVNQFIDITDFDKESGEALIKSTLADTHPLHPIGASETSKLVLASVERIWDGLFARGSSINDGPLYCVVLCRLNEIFYTTNSEYVATNDIAEEGSICLVWIRLSDNAESASAAYDEFCAMVNQTDALVIYGQVETLCFSLNEPQGRAVAKAVGFYGDGTTDTIEITSAICVETIDEWGVIPVSNGQVNARLMQDFIKARDRDEISVLQEIDTDYSGKYFVDGDGIETLCDGLWRYVEEMTGNKRPEQFVLAERLEPSFETEKLCNEPFPLFNQQHTVIHTEAFGNFTYAIYQLKGDKQYYLYITIGGVDYDLGVVDNGFFPLDIERFVNSRMQTTELSAQMVVYKLVRQPYNLSTTTYFTIQDNTPIHLYSIEITSPAGEEYDIDMDGALETVCNHGGSMSVNYWIYEWDIDAGEVHVADVIDQLNCAQFYYDSEKNCFIAAIRDRTPLGAWSWKHPSYLYRDSTLIQVAEDATHWEQ